MKSYIFTLEFNRREPQTYTPVHIINIDIPDNHEEATLGAFQICELCEKVRAKIRCSQLFCKIAALKNVPKPPGKMSVAEPCFYSKGSITGFFQGILRNYSENLFFRRPLNSNFSGISCHLCS